MTTKSDTKSKKPAEACKATGTERTATYLALLDYDHSDRYQMHMSSRAAVFGSWSASPDSDEDECEGDGGDDVDEVEFMREKMARALGRRHHEIPRSSARDLMGIFGSSRDTYDRYERDMYDRYESYERVVTVGPESPKDRLRLIASKDMSALETVKKYAVMPDYLNMDGDNSKASAQSRSRKLRGAFVEEGHACWAILQILEDNQEHMTVSLPTEPESGTTYKLTRVKYPVSSLCMDSREREIKVRDAIRAYIDDHREGYYEEMVLGKPKEPQEQCAWEQKYRSPSVYNGARLQGLNDSSSHERGDVNFSDIRKDLLTTLKQVEKAEAHWKEHKKMYLGGNKRDMAKAVMLKIVGEPAPLWAACDERGSRGKFAKASLEYMITDSDVRAYNR